MMKRTDNINRFETAYSKSGGFDIWDAERDLDFLIRTKQIVGFSTAEECSTRQLVYINNLDCLDKIPSHLFGLPVSVYLERRKASYRDEEVIHELVRETDTSFTSPDKEGKTFLDYVKDAVMFIFNSIA